MFKRLAPWFGVFLLAFVGGLLAVFGLDSLSDPANLVPMAGAVLAALLLILAGPRESVQLGSRTVPWNALVGAAYILLAVVFTVSSIRPTTIDGGAIAWIDTAASVAMGGLLVWFGVQIARNSRHVNLHPTREVRD